MLVDLVDGGGIRAAHESMRAAIETAMGRLDLVSPHHAGEGYRPHRTVVPGPRPRTGAPLRADAVLAVHTLH